MLAVELLERVIGKHRRVDLLCDAQQEGVAAPDRAGGRMDVLAPHGGLFEAGQLGRVDPVRERRVDDHRDLGVRMVAPKLGDGLLQLLQAGQ